MTASARFPLTRDPAWKSGPGEIVLGVDIIELVSSSMYVEPLTMYREYVQNAADAIDEARERGLAAGRIDITVDPSMRTVRIRDDGTGLNCRAFVRRLTGFGASEKRRQQRRGFRGVGRLAALGYCQELIFRSQAEGESVVSELRWDGRVLRSVLRAADSTSTLADAVRRAVSHRRCPAVVADRFFEVELRGVVRHGRDDLLNDLTIGQYLAAIAPVPFGPSFRHAEQLSAFLARQGVSGDIEIYVNGYGPLYRPHSDTIQMKEGVASTVVAPEFFKVPGLDGSLAACGWLLHHDYLGAIPRDASVRGLRLRAGNIQIGGDDIFAELFPESRFNHWVVAEVHVLDRRIVPNGRRDYFEHSTHFANLCNYLAPLTRHVAARCRKRSQHRRLMRNAALLEERALRDLAILKQGALTEAACERYRGELKATIRRMEKIAESPSLASDERAELRKRCRKIQARIVRMTALNGRAAPLGSLPAQRRRAYEEVLSLIYECTSDSRIAKDLVERILARLSSQ